jgi:hypothetical protein
MVAVMYEAFNIHNLAKQKSHSEVTRVEDYDLWN